MANKSDYFGLSYIVSLILAIIPFTSWICGAITDLPKARLLRESFVLSDLVSFSGLLTLSL